LVIIGTETDYPKLNQIQSFLKSSIDIKDVFVTLPMNATIELIRRSDLLIGSDSAPLHIAGGVNTPSIGLFGPTNPEFSKPRGKNHTVIYYKLFCSASESEQFCTRDAGRTCPTIDCMKSITVKEIMEKAELILNPVYH
jgi:ADP-heptose:LPS heptosyltransferase